MRQTQPDLRSKQVSGRALRELAFQVVRLWVAELSPNTRITMSIGEVKRLAALLERSIAAALKKQMQDSVRCLEWLAEVDEGSGHIDAASALHDAARIISADGEALHEM